jgi:hypothetical protein
VNIEKTVVSECIKILSLRSNDRSDIGRDGHLFTMAVIATLRTAQKGRGLIHCVAYCVYCETIIV